MFHVHQCFNAVGHGTFFNGLVFDGLNESSFTWVYDCGSKRKTKINQEITNLDQWELWPEEIDLLVLSHFDDDHVNGVERLLQTRKVRVLALPYMDIGHILAGAASVNTDPCSASTATFQIDPVGWLQSRGLGGQVNTILMVQGGGPDDENPQPDRNAAPLPGGPDNLNREIDEPARTARRTASPHPSNRQTSNHGKGSTPSVLNWQHGTPTMANQLPFELMFFNAKQPDLFHQDKTGNLVARRSHRPLSDVQADVDAIVKRYRLNDLSRQPRKKWRDALRGVYDKHFGTSSQQRNNISLCLLARPIDFELCFCTYFYRYGITTWYPRPLNTKAFAHTNIERGGTLLLGDLRINKATLSEMQAHFGIRRWKDIGTVQVPHHGSEHSWEPGSAAAFSPELFVHCVPDSSPHHPHTNVRKDLWPIACVHEANYQRGVAIDYHLI